MNPAGCYHYCSQRNSPSHLGVSPQGLLNLPPQMSIIPHVFQAEGRLTNVENLAGCSESWSFNSLTNQSTLSVDRANVWWYCRGPLLETLPSNWAGTCALVQLAVPFTLAFRFSAHATTSRKRRDIGTEVATSQRFLESPCLYWCHWGS
jgi:hypothetical protein